MKQESLFDNDAAEPAGKLVPLGVPGGAPRLTKAQKLFNTLIRKIEAQRLLLRQWHDFVPVYQQRFASEIEPLQKRLQERQRAMAVLLDRTLDGTRNGPGRALTKRERAKVQDILLGLLVDLLRDAEDAELVRLYDKHSDVSFEEEKSEGMEIVEAMASSMFGVEIEPGHGAKSPEELAELIGEKMLAGEAARAAEPPAAPPRKKSAKAAAKEALRQQAREGASRSLREVYRKLASELHPDREPDAQERARKTALMQKVNQAYESGDLLALLELQLSIEQIDATALAGLAQERIEHYNLVLKEQLGRLQDELSDVTGPFVMMASGPGAREFTPEQVQRSLDDDVRELRTALKEIDSDLAAFEDVKVLKARLKHYRIDEDGGDGDEWELLQAMLMSAPPPRRRR